MMASSRARFLLQNDKSENDLARLGIRLPRKKYEPLPETKREGKKPLNLVNKKVVENLKNTCMNTKKSSKNGVHLNDGKLSENHNASPSNETAESAVEMVSEITLTSSRRKPDFGKAQENNILLLGEYAEDIYSHLRALENKYAVRCYHLSGQAVTPRMRAVLVDYLVDIHTQFHLVPETLYLAVNIMDRFLQDFFTIHKKNLQLVGVTSLLLACKYEEVQFPSIYDLVYVSDNAFTKHDVITMEMCISKVVGYCFGAPLAPHFLRRYSFAISASTQVHALAKYFMELTLGEYEFCHIKQSLVAAAALYLSLFVFSGKEFLWTDVLRHISKYTEEKVMPVSRKIAEIASSQVVCKLKTVHKKYSSRKFLSVSVMEELPSHLTVFLNA